MLIGAAAATTGLVVGGCSSSASDSGGGATAVNVVLTPDGCEPSPASVNAGLITFNVTNKNANAVSEAELLKGDTVLAEKENLTPGLSGSFSSRLQPGKYVLSCPNAKTPRSDFTVTGAVGS